MASQKLQNRGSLRFLVCLLGVSLLSLHLVLQVSAEAVTSGSSTWANPSVMAIKQVGQSSTVQSSPVLLDNTDCVSATYRLPTTNSMGMGCFSQTGLGLLESDSGIIIFHGTDEGVPLQTFSTHQVIVPWPNHSGLFILDTVSTGGSYISIYTAPVTVIKDYRNVAQQLTGKQLTASPDRQIKDRFGQRLVINAQSIAFTDDGEWLIAETLMGSFVRVNLIDYTVKPFAPSYSMAGNPAVSKSRLAVARDGDSGAIYNKDNDTFRVYDLANCTPPAANAVAETCPFYDYLPYIKGQIPALQSIRHVRYINERLLSFEAYTSSNNGSVYLLAPEKSIAHQIDYLGLGDSYTSGEGAFDYLDGTDRPENMCHLSIRSYPLLIANDLFSSAGAHSVACSGAVINDVASTSESYKGQVRGALDFKHLREENPVLLNTIYANYTPGFIAQNRFVNKYQPAIITVSVGGDDIGFGKILEQCVGLHISVNRSDNDCFNTYEDRLEILQLINRTSKHWLAMFKQLRSQAPASAIYVIGYPQIALDSGNCALNVHLSKAELEFGTELINHLNEAIMQASKQAEVNFVDISRALNGHRMCETDSSDVAVNGLTAGKDAGIFGINVLGKESYHPNALGQKLIEQAILKQTNNLKQSVSHNETTYQANESILSVKKTGRNLYVRHPATFTNSGTIKKGSMELISAKGALFALKPATSYSVNLDGPDGINIGTINSDNNGDISGQISLPADSVAGSHTLDILGKNQADKDTDITQPIYIPVNTTDADGDGVPNQADSCQFAVNSNVDADYDNIDDACDSVIFSSSSTPGSSVMQSSLRTTTARLGTSSMISAAVMPSTSVQQAIPQHSSTSQKSQQKLKPIAASTNIKPKSSNRIKIKIGWLYWLILAILLWITILLLGQYFERAVDRRLPAA